MRLPLLALLLSLTGLLAQTPLAPLPKDGFVTVAQITSDFASQPDAALQKYQGHNLLVYGVVHHVAQGDDKNSNPLAVFLQAPNRSTPDVKCVFTPAGIPAYGQDAEVQISEDGSQATIYHRSDRRSGKLRGSEPFIVAGKKVGIKGTFHKFVAGDIVLSDCSKESKERIDRALRTHRVPRD